MFKICKCSLDRKSFQTGFLLKNPVFTIKKIVEFQKHFGIAPDPLSTFVNQGLLIHLTKAKQSAAKLFDTYQWHRSCYSY